MIKYFHDQLSLPFENFLNLNLYNDPREEVIDF